ncbi:MAG: DUF58 domain-containing protein [Nocardioidaceae bacterium]
METTPPRRVRSWLGIINPTGWTVLAIAVVAAVVASRTHWREATVLAVASIALLVLAAPLLLGRVRVGVELVLEPLRVVAGETVSGSVTVTNLASGRMLPSMLDLPVGDALHRYGLPALAADASHEESFTVRTERRGVIPVGPAITRRGDPLGLYSRDFSWTEVQEILVRPVMVPLESLGAGLLRDLEGVSTDAVSQSDLAFHALREYVPGDDLRHVHWRSSAKAMAAAGRTQLLVRQYLDTRRSHATVVVDDEVASWPDPEDFETAMAVAASIAVRAVLDEFDTSFMCGDQAASGNNGHVALDAVSRATLGHTGLATSAQRAAVVSPDTSLLFLITGPGATFGQMRLAASAFPSEVRRIAMVVDATVSSRATDADGIPILHLADKADLGALLRWSLS